jgi:hypothetical protein
MSHTAFPNESVNASQIVIATQDKINKMRQNITEMEVKHGKYEVIEKVLDNQTVCIK